MWWDQLMLDTDSTLWQAPLVTKGISYCLHVVPLRGRLLDKINPCFLHCSEKCHQDMCITHKQASLYLSAREYRAHHKRTPLKNPALGSEKNQRTL